MFREIDEALPRIDMREAVETMDNKTYDQRNEIFPKLCQEISWRAESHVYVADEIAR